MGGGRVQPDDTNDDTEFLARLDGGKNTAAARQVTGRLERSQGRPNAYAWTAPSRSTVSVFGHTRHPRPLIDPIRVRALLEGVGLID